MKFKLDFEIKPPANMITIRQNIFMAGSCFAENIGVKMRTNKFNAVMNPHGILFNPESIFTCIQTLKEEKYFTEKDLFEYNGLWYSWQHHGEFSGLDNQETLIKINESQKKSIDQFNKSDNIILTFGSAFVYRNLKNDEVVANCHKVPQKNFKRELLTVEHIVSKYSQLNSSLKEKQFIFTVSPVRYSKEGIAENNLSKSILIQAVHEICNQFPMACYFPSYEIVIDELRDYRWFKDDLCHPNQQAIDYVWDRFSETVFDTETKNILNEIKEIVAAKNHRPINPLSIQHKDFLKKYLEKTQTLQQRYLFLNFKEEIDYFKTQQPRV